MILDLREQSIFRCPVTLATTLVAVALCAWLGAGWLNCTAVLVAGLVLTKLIALPHSFTVSPQRVQELQSRKPRAVCVITGANSGIGLATGAQPPSRESRKLFAPPPLIHTHSFMIKPTSSVHAVRWLSSVRARRAVHVMRSRC